MPAKRKFPARTSTEDNYLTSALASPMDNIFQACCDLMEFVGKDLGYSYKEICVIGNLYLQGCVLWLLGMVCAVEGYRLLHRANVRFAKWISAYGILDGAVSSTVFALLIRRYYGGGAIAFDRCVADLFWLAKKSHTTYEVVNIWVFIIGFLIVLFMQLAFLLFIRHRRRTAESRDR